ncbi:MAG TPA: hypothetical protein VJ044_06260, partial [Candidatus Hodarchaeales archaeon]|nr:hypothetical protein [Candidatus Hodarchaeales archaeon]
MEAGEPGVPERSVGKLQNTNTTFENISSPLVFIVEETGLFTNTYSNSYQFPSNLTSPIPSSVLNSISLNLSDLWYYLDTDISYKDNSYLTPFTPSADNIWGPNRAQSNMSIDNDGGPISVRFTMFTSQSSLWYTTYHLPAWQDSHLPSILGNTTILEGIFRSNISESLRFSETGYLIWLRFRFPGLPGIPYNMISVILNSSAAFQLTSDSIAVEPDLSEIYLYPGRNMTDSRLKMTSIGSGWFRFQLNLTSILESVFPADSPLRNIAEIVFSNLTDAWLELQSFTFVDGKIDCWLSNITWTTHIQQESKELWMQENLPFKDGEGRPLINSSLNNNENIFWNESRSSWRVLVTTWPVDLSELNESSHFVPVWSFNRQILTYTWSLWL